ncbi:hypothetical protein [Polyangium sp. y55x31]|uniref:hypothetical protein n=1 Tax=Polyangium sp. y55x31 TaxID=3042688 RepID=UPI0024824694|nr:hypothetical protein [Polyangium sp. y55x31]MDI1484224.1 hypothetical protein [Polyangium sp. y55x31]
MAYKHLRSEEMLQVSSSWIDPQSPARAAILASADLSGKLPRIEEAHAGLAAAAQPAKLPRMNALSAEEARLDVRHDSIIRGVFGLLTATAEMLDGEAAAELLALRDTLIPEGLSSMQKTYRAEAGQAAQLEDRLTPAVVARTDAILVGQGPSQKSLTHYLQEWITIGKKLGGLEDEKGRLLAEQQSDASSGLALVKARNRWIRVVNALVADGELAELPAPTDTLVFGPLRDAEKKAVLRTRTTHAAKETTGEVDTIPEAP